MDKKPKVNIGIEIEINNTTGLKVDTKKWSIDTEHCGYELRSFPCKSPAEIKGLISSIEKMSKTTNSAFRNAGTHIHIDFLNDSHIPSKIDLTRLQVLKGKDGVYKNPLGTKKRFVWVSKDGELWAAPREYLASKPEHLNPENASFLVGNTYLQSIKKFFILGIRFSDVLFGLQHPSRRFNKYCHSIAEWNESTLLKAKTVNDICHGENLAQGHRRHMFNILSFPKFGTIEIRMIKASLNHKEIWRQVYLFGKMAQLAKSNNKIPKAVGNVSKDFLILMDACGIHGKARRELSSRLSTMMSKRWTARCFNCNEKWNIHNFYDYGLSRPVCKNCHERYIFCANCGRSCYRKYEFYLIDNRAIGGRHLCMPCSRGGTRNQLKVSEKYGSVWIMGLKIGCGVSKTGPVTLKKLRKTFLKTKKRKKHKGYQ